MDCDKRMHKKLLYRNLWRATLRTNEDNEAEIYFERKLSQQTVQCKLI